MTDFDPERREPLKLGVVTASALVVGELWPSGPADAAQPASAAPSPSAPAVPVDVLLRVNGREHRLTLDPRTTLLDALREHLHLTGSKKGCGLGQCGACTVLMDGRRVKSCLSLEALVEGRDITTIEGLARGDAVHPLQSGVHRPRCLSVRLLHSGTDHGRRGLHRRGPRGIGAGHPRVDERQRLPILRHGRSDEEL